MRSKHKKLLFPYGMREDVFSQNANCHFDKIYLINDIEKGIVKINTYRRKSCRSGEAGLCIRKRKR